MERLPGFNVANHFEKRQLLIAINCVAALSIFFFGYALATDLMYKRANSTSLRSRNDGWSEQFEALHRFDGFWICR
jgi:hypothetical protein